MSDAPLRKIALWGPPQAGKTALLSYLREQTAKGSWSVSKTTESESFATTMSDRLKANRFPAPTVPGDVENVVYRMSNGPRRALLSMQDRAGGRWLALAPEEKTALLDADALMIVVEPRANAAELQRQLRDMLETLALERRQEIDSRPVAICVSKADEFMQSAEDVEAAKRDPDRFVRERLREQVRPELRVFVQRHCPNHQFFPVSAVGVRVVNGLVRPAVFYDEQLELRVVSNGTPINLTEPFDWIFDRLEGAA